MFSFSELATTKQKKLEGDRHAKDQTEILLYMGKRIRIQTKMFSCFHILFYFPFCVFVKVLLFETVYIRKRNVVVLVIQDV